MDECEEIIDNKTVSVEKHNKNLPVKEYNKTVFIKENTSLSPRKSFVASSILCLLVSVIITGFFCLFLCYFTAKKKITRLLLKREVR